MPSTFSSVEAQDIISAARRALKTIDEIIEEQEGYSKEIAELYDQLLDQSGNRLAKSIPLIRMGPGKYRTLTGGKKGGTKSNLYLAAKSGADATVQTHSGRYDAQECYKRALDVAGVDEESDTFKELVHVGYKKWFQVEVTEKTPEEWRSTRAVIERTIKAAEPALQGALARLFIGGQTKQIAFDALSKLREINVYRIADMLLYWPETLQKDYNSKDWIFCRFQEGGEERDGILSCLQKEIDGFKMGSVDTRPFSSEDAQHVLDQLEGLDSIPASIAAAQKDMKDRIPAAIDEMRECDVRAHLAQIPIDELGKQKTGAQIKKLQDVDVTTLADLYERLSSPEKGDLPGVGPKTRDAIEAYLNPIVVDIRKRWRLKLAADDKSDAAVRLLRTAQVYLELGSLYEKAQRALAGMKPLSDTQIDALRCAADPVDWLLADDECVSAAGNAMEAANKQLESEDGAWLISMLDGSKVRRLESNLASISEARKAFRAHPDAFMKVIEEVAPEVLAPAEPAAADVVPAKEPAPTKQPKREATAKKKSQQSMTSERARKILAGQISPDQYDSPTVMGNLLLQRTFFFSPEDISWDGEHHSIVTINLNAAQVEELDEEALSVLTNKTVNIFGTVLTEVEKDEGLFIPRRRIAAGIRKALPEGDLTGLALCYLIGCGGAFSWRGTENCYQVYFDPRLERGIPQFFSLVARLIWDIRDQFLMSDASFDIMFFRTRNFDADVFLGEVEERVSGAEECPNLLHVSGRPEIKIS